MEAQTRAVLTFTQINGPWPAAILLAALLAGGSLVIWQYRRERGALDNRARHGLAALRCVVWLLIVTALSGPALVPVETRRLLPEVVVLRDSSQSMTVRDVYEGEFASRLANKLGCTVESLETSPPTRAALAERLWREATSEPSSGARSKGSQTNGAQSDRVQSLWKQLRSRSRVHVVDFATDAADSLATPPLEADGLWPAWQTTGRATDLSVAIRAALEVEGAAAAVLITDGQHSTRDDPRDAAREAARRGVPLLIVGMGSPRRPRDVRVANVYCRPHVWKNEPFEVETLLTYHVPNTTNVQLELVESRGEEPTGDAARDAASNAAQPNVGGTDTANQATATDSGVRRLGDARVVASVQVSLAANANQLVHRFSHRIESPGRYSLAVRVKLADGDDSDENGASPSSELQVLDKEQLRVLVVAGEASWDFQQVERLLNREATVAASCWLQTADPEIRATGSRALERLPATQEELDWYDVLLLLDPDPTLLPESWGDLVTRFAAEHAGGVLYSPGPRHASAFLSAPVGGAVRRLLPVDLPEGAELQLGARSGRTEQPWQARVAAAQADHPVLRLAGESTENAALWEQMPPLFASFPVREARPASRTLLEHGDPTVRSATGPRPLLVVGQFRSAHAAFLGFQGIWRWRGIDGREDWGDRLWLQLVRYLAEGRAWEGRRRGRLQTDRPLYEPGDRVTISLQLEPTVTGATAPPANAPDAATPSTTDAAAPDVAQPGELVARPDSAANGGVMLARISEQDQPLPLHAVAEQPGLYEGVWTARRTGQFTVSVVLEAPDMAAPGTTRVGGERADTEPLQASFRVEPPQAEAKALWLDEVRLRELAELSQGRYFDAADAAHVVDAIPDRRELVSTRRPAELLWDRASVLFAIACLLCVEWAVRRRYKLV